MIDTIILESPPITKDTEEKAIKACMKKYAIDCESGEIIYEFTSGSLQNSADNRISLKVLSDRWVNDGDGTSAHKIKIEPYLRIECSVHKQMCGHNIYGGTSDFQMACKWIILKIAKLLKCDLPDYSEWFVNKVDSTETYNLENDSAVKAWFRHMRLAEYSRRNDAIRFFGNTGMFIPGTSTTIKFYHKGTEFWKHDRRNLKTMLSVGEIEALQEIANKMLRCEVSIKIRKLKYDFGRIVKVKDITPEYLQKVYDAEIEKVMRGFTGDVKMVRKAEDVRRILYNEHSDALAGALMGTWYQLATFGERYVKEKMKKRTFYYHRKKLIDAGCSWLGTDIIVAENEYPLDFQPVRSDSRWVNYIFPEIQAKIEYVRSVA